MLNNNIKYAREEFELTQKEFGYILGVSEFTVSGWETGKDYISLKHIVKICNHFDLSADYLLGLTRKNVYYSKINKLNSKSIGNKLKSIRSKLNLTQEKFAKELQISQSSYNLYETGNRLISSVTLFLLANKYKISIDEILERKKK